MGLGVHGGGLGVARWLLRQGALVTVTDTASREALAAPLAALDAAAAELGVAVRYTLGEHRADDVTGSDMLVVNPAVRPSSPWLKLAREAGVPVETEMTLFFRACPGPILGVTGTKGKTTTALMLAAMLRERFPDTVAAGNLRVSALEALDSIAKDTPVVLELSSFQLERLGAVGLSPHWSLITNLSSDHVNWHGSLEAYAAAKRQIYWHQPPTGAVALNGDDAGSAAFFSLRDADGKRRGGRPIIVDGGEHSTFAGIASKDGDEAATRVELRGGSALRRGDTVVWRDPAGAFGASTDAEGETLFEREDVRLPGEHNLRNALLAAALARAFGVDAAAIRRALHGFAGVEHRLELVRELDGVRYVNDTTATNPAAAIAALEATRGPIVLIAGGADKALEFQAFGEQIGIHVEALVLLEGTATQAIREYVEAPLSGRPGLSIHGPYGDFTEAIRVARGLAEPGATVLLSPGCASFGMFKNEFHRGEEFRRIVAQL
jgi:UDP-N-acetylmuramoylalanine--D-glutamate ligase